jgi:chromosomal replication initiation ATPase DnaA
MSDARPQWIALPRFAVIRLLRVLLRLSFPSIGRVVSRDHSSCCHAFARCLHRRGHDLEFRRRYRAALLRLRSEGLTRK